MPHFTKRTASIFVMICGLFISKPAYSQSSHYLNYPEKKFDKARFLYQNGQYAAARNLFEDLLRDHPNREIQAEASYYIANTAVRLDKPNAGDLIEKFVANYPESPKRNFAYLDAANYYFDNARYSYALKWYNKTTDIDVPYAQREDFYFKAGYANFATNNFRKAEDYFKEIQFSPKYSQQAKYYMGYIAYQNDDYNQAAGYFSKLKNRPEYQNKLDYFEADMSFKLGDFDKAIQMGTKALESARGVDRSELSKIVGESYFNQKKYAEAIPYLEAYRGKKNRYNNTDWYQLGFAYFKTGDYEKAVSHFNKIIGERNAVAQNAYFHMGQAYLKLNQKQEARNAFRSASQMDADPALAEAAALSHAKLSYETGNLLQNIPEILAAFIDRYPANTETSEIKKLLVDALLTSKNYQAALAFVRKNKNVVDKSTYQKLLYLRGLELLSEENEKAAYPLLTEASKLNADPLRSAQTLFWLAELDYRQKNYLASIERYTAFMQHPGSNRSGLLNDAAYNLAYAYYQTGRYAEAAAHFKKFTSASVTDSQKTEDAFMRLGDSYFALKQFWPALESYNAALASQTPNADLAEFHKALAYGQLGRIDAKKTALEKVLNTYPSSTLRDDAYYELGNTLLNENREDEAMAAYEKLTREYRMSSLVPKALLKMGLIYYNRRENEAALTAYKRLAQDFPDTPEARQALSSARLAYVELSRGNEYAQWISGLSFAEVTDADIQNTLFESAENLWMNGNKDKAIKDYQSYLQKYPSGLHAQRIRNTLGEYYFNRSDYPNALTYFTPLTQSRNEYSEGALSRMAQISLESAQWTTVIPLLERLESQAETTENKQFAIANLMRAHQGLGDVEKAATYAQTVANDTTYPSKAQQDARLLLARKALSANDFDTAIRYYKILDKSGVGSLAAESLYVQALSENKKNNYKNSNLIIQKLAKDYPGYKEFAVKGLILMAQNFYALDDAFQATFILENVIKNFPDYPQEVDRAQVLLDEIKQKEALRENNTTNDKN